MAKAITFFSEHKILVFFVVAILVMVAAYLAVKSPDEAGIQTQTIELTTVRQIVEETGIVEAVQEADLSFEQTGKVLSLFVAKGDTVAAGEALVALDSSAQEAELAAARAQLAIEESALTQLKSNAQSGASPDSEFALSQQQQETLVENAYRKLLSSDLETYTVNNTVTATPPLISGRFTGPEGQYKIVIEQTSITSDVYELRVFGIEKPEHVSINKTSTTPLGTYGLLISFPDGISTYDDTVWYMDIPNRNGSSYTTNLNAYIAAKETGGITAVQIGASTEDIRGQEARVDKARAAVTSAEIQLSRRVLRAPFSGIVTGLFVARGETVAPGTPVVSLISQSEYEISVHVPEADIAEISIGDTADVIFDAYDDYVFRAHVTFITPSALIDNDVSTFEVTLRFDEPDERIRAGLSADVEILAVERIGVLALPSRAIVEPSRSERFVRALRDGQLVEIPVTTGVRGSDGTTEIVSGLIEGDEVIVFISEESLVALGGSR